MSIMRYLPIKLFLLSAYLILTSQSLAQETNKTTSSKASFQLSVWPHQMVVHKYQPINIRFALNNVTNHEDSIRLWFWPIPFGHHSDLHSLMLRCRNQKTGKEVQYTWPPAVMAVADAQGKEFPELFHSKQSVGNTLDFRQFCVLPPGKYILELQYDTRFIPSWIKPDKRAWHGITNKESIQIHVLNLQ